jgi:chemotaxis protein methyltransferase CheR
VEFGLFQQLIHDEAGIFLSPMKRAFLGARLTRRVRHLGLSSLTDYYRYVLASGAEERKHLLDAICTSETRFFREPAQFEFLEREIIPSWLASPRRAKTVRVWSAACSTGEEPFSLAMSLHAGLAGAGWSIGITATDLSTRVLARAAKAEWSITQAGEIPEPYLKRYMLKGKRTREGIMKAGPELRSIVNFARLNLNQPTYPITGRFDMIFCRNVLIYFDEQGKRAVADRLVQHLTPGGWLFFGSAESGGGWRPDLVTVRPSICQLR